MKIKHCILFRFAEITHYYQVPVNKEISLFNDWFILGLEPPGDCSVSDERTSGDGSNKTLDSQ